MEKAGDQPGERAREEGAKVELGGRHWGDIDLERKN
jgi:hypothetical protein